MGSQILFWHLYRSLKPKGKAMKTKLGIIIVVSMLFVSCGTLQPNGYNAFTHSAFYSVADPLEYFGIKGKTFEGRLFEIHAGGNGYMSRSTVKSYAMWAAGKAAYDNGYEEFALLIEDGSVSTSLQTNGYTSKYGYNSSTYQVNKYMVDLVILLITENDYSYVDKIYKTTKYYQPGSKI